MTDSPPTIPTPATGRGLRLLGLATLALLLAATGCLRSKPPPLEKVIVGNWIDWRGGGLTFRPDGTWTALGQAEVQGTYFLGPRYVLRRFFEGPWVEVAFYCDDGRLAWWDDDYGGSWVKEAASGKKTSRAVRAKRYDAVVQSNMARNVVGVWVSEPRQWVLELGGDLRWSSPNWTDPLYRLPNPRGFYVMGSAHEVLLQREELLRGEYLRLEGDHLVCVGEDLSTNIFHRLPASAPPPEK